MLRAAQNWITRLFLPALFLLICAVVWWSIRELNDLSRREIASVLQTIVGMTRDSVQTWEEETRADVSFWAEQGTVKSAVADLVKSAGDPAVLGSHPALAELRRELLPTIKESGYLDFAVIAPNGDELASLSDAELGQQDLYEREHPAIVAAFSGKSTISPSFNVYSSRPGASAANVRPVTSLLALAPVYDDLQHVIAVFAFELDAAHELNVITRPARMNQSGETYIIDQHGHMLTESRFVPPHGAEIDVRDPGAAPLNADGSRPAPELLPLTLAARTALRHEAGTDVDGYRDYRGTTVVGSWTYIPELDVAVITEMDKSEAYARYYISRRLTLFLLLTTFGGLLVLGILRIRIARQRAAAEAREELLAVVAHDLRNPLQSIALNSASLLKLIDTGEFGARTRKCADGIRLSAQRLKTLVDDLLHAAQIEAGKLTVAPQRQAVQPIVESAAAVLEPLARESGLKFAFQVPAGLPDGNIDAGRITQVLSNLVGNAIKFTPSGGSIDIRVSDAGEFVQFEIADTGSGIDPQHLPHLFKRYWQAGNNAHKGAGLGLFIVKGIVEAHGGRIWVESQPGQGTHVFFTLPSAR